MCTRKCGWAQTHRSHPTWRAYTRHTRTRKLNLLIKIGFANIVPVHVLVRARFKDEFCDDCKTCDELRDKSIDVFSACVRSRTGDAWLTATMRDSSAHAHTEHVAASSSCVSSSNLLAPKKTETQSRNNAPVPPTPSPSPSLPPSDNQQIGLPCVPL